MPPHRRKSGRRPTSGARTAEGAGIAAPLEEARAWLEPRLARVPAELAEAIRSSLEAAAPHVSPSSSVADTLALAALEGFDRVLAGTRGRESAVHLLAADASLTYAFEAAAELGEDLLRLADRVGPRGRLGRGLGKLAPGASIAE
ncbi:MAG: hypothetical protein ACE5HP_05370 [Gemmatimonadota bacterium]